MRHSAFFVFAIASVVVLCSCESGYDQESDESTGVDEVVHLPASENSDSNAVYRSPFIVDELDTAASLPKSARDGDDLHASHYPKDANSGDTSQNANRGVRAPGSDTEPLDDFESEVGPVDGDIGTASDLDATMNDDSTSTPVDEPPFVEDHSFPETTTEVVELDDNIEENDETDASIVDGEEYALDDEDDVEEDADMVLDDFVAEGEDLMTVERDVVSALRYFRRAAVLGHVGAMATVGVLLSSGDVGITRDLSKGSHFTRMAAEHGQADAQASLAFLYASGLADRYGVEKNKAKALLYWTVAAEGGSVFAQVALGYRYFFGVGVPKSCPAASRYYRRAARSIATDPRHTPSLENFLTGSPPLPSTLTKGRGGAERLDEDSVGVPESSESTSTDNELLEYNRHKAAHGNGDSLTAIAGLHLFGGQGVARDEAAAVNHLHAAAANGHGEAHGMLAHLALNRRDNTTAFEHFEKAAEADTGMGLYGLGMMYLHGVGVERDTEKAANLFINATEHQHADAAYHIGMLYYRGEGVPQNGAEAYRYFQHASRLGQTQAKMNLAVMTLEAHFPVSTPNCERGVRLLKEVSESGEWNTLLALASDDLEAGDMFSAVYRYSQAAQAGIEVAQYNAALLMELSAKHAERGVAKTLSPGILFESVTKFDPENPLNTSDELQHWRPDRLREEAIELYELSFGQGYVPSVLRSGHLAYTEMKDFQRAAAAYEEGSSLRNSECSVSLGFMYFYGLGVVSDRLKTVQYLEKARLDSSEGAIPAAIALLLARTAWWLSDHALKGRTWDDVQHAIGDILTIPSASFSGESKMSSDFVLLSALASLLAVVVLARRRRLKREQGSAEDSAGEDDSEMEDNLPREFGHVYEE